jgi:hypothetical protein
VDAFAETKGRWALSFNWDAAGRTWGDDRTSSNATRSLTSTLTWKRLAWAQLLVSGTRARTIDLASGVPAQLNQARVRWGGSALDIAFTLEGRQSELLRESDALRLVRAREAVASATWQFPRHLYLKLQTFAVRYDGTETEGVDKFLKAFLGWQPNAFTGAYLGWSGQRNRDPLAIDPTERMVQRGLFAKLAYALQF